MTRIHNDSTTTFSAASSSFPSKAVTVLPQPQAYSHSKPRSGGDEAPSSSYSYVLRIVLLPRSKNVLISRRVAAASGRFSRFKSFFANLFSALKAVKRVTSTALTVETEGRAEGRAVSDSRDLGFSRGGDGDGDSDVGDDGGSFTFEEEKLMKQSKVSLSLDEALISGNDSHDFLYLFSHHDNHALFYFWTSCLDHLAIPERRLRGKVDKEVSELWRASPFGITPVARVGAFQDSS